MIKSSFTPPAIDQATVDYYVAKGKRERSRAFANLIRSLFSQSGQRETPLSNTLRAKVRTA